MRPSGEAAATAPNRGNNRSETDSHRPGPPPGPGVYTFADLLEPHGGAPPMLPPMTYRRPSSATALAERLHSLGARGSVSHRPGVVPMPGVYTSTSLWV